MISRDRARQRPVMIVIAVCTAAGLLLRLYQLTRPGYLTGVTEYDDGVLFGNALRLANGVIPYRDFAVVQPPGSILLMTPVALLAKATGTAWGLGIARLLTVGADCAAIVFLGVLVRHRGPLAAGVACGIYAVDPDALVASHTFLLEPWLNMLCLAGAVLAFDGDRLAGGRRASAAPGAPSPARGRTGNSRLAWAGAVFGFAAAVKLWALVPLAVLVVLALPHVRRVAALAGGAVAGIALPLLPFLFLAPGGLFRGVLVGQFVRSSNGGQAQLLQRLADMLGLSVFPSFPLGPILLLTAVVVAALYLAGSLAGARLPAALDWYALVTAAAVTVMFLLPRLYYHHYGAFFGQFLALVLALPAGRLALWASSASTGIAPAPAASLSPANAARAPAASSATSVPSPSGGASGSGTPASTPAPSSPSVPARTLGFPATAAGVVAVVAAVLVAWAGARDLVTESRLSENSAAAVADRLIPPGACVLTNEAVFTVTASRFVSDTPGCPALVDSFGTLITMTSGRDMGAAPPVLRTVTAVWRSAFERASYVWLLTGSQGQIPWTRSLDAYFRAHYRLIGLASRDRPTPGIPQAGIYARRT